MYALFLICAGLAATFVLETLVFLPLFLKKDGYFIAAFYCVNVATNVSLNLVFSVIIHLLGAFGVDVGADAVAAYLLGCLTVLFEAAVVWAEYAVLKEFHSYKNLFGYTVAANALSAVAGSVLVAFFLHIF